MSERKAFKFYRSYYEVAQELTPLQREKYLMAILQKQFEGKEPKLKGQANFAYMSQKHSIERQCKGFEGRKLRADPGPGGAAGGGSGPKPQEEEKEKEEVKKERKKTLLQRKVSFRSKIKEFSEQYPYEMLKEFYEYWTEKNQAGVKMRFEKEKTFEVGKRLARWAANGKFTKSNQQTDKNYDRLD